MALEFYRSGELVRLEEVRGVAAARKDDSTETEVSTERARDEYGLSASEVGALGTMGVKVVEARDEHSLSHIYRTPTGISVDHGFIDLHLDPNFSEPQALEFLAARDLEVVHQHRFARNLFLVRRTAPNHKNRIEVLSASFNEVQHAEPEMPVIVTGRQSTKDEGANLLWHLEAIGVDPNEATGKGVRVAVIDQGFWLEHPALAGALERGACFDSLNGGFSSPCAIEPRDHGTMMAGLLAARPVGKVRGVAPEAMVMPLIVAASENVALPSDFARAIAYAAEPRLENDPRAGADVIVCALGPRSGVWPMSRAIDFALTFAATFGRGRKGTPIFWAVPNREASASDDEVCAHASTIAVTAHRDESVAPAPCAFGPIVDIAAPGVEVFGPTYEKKGKVTEGLSTGSSPASALAGGVAALILERQPGLTARNIQRKICRQAKRDFEGFGKAEHHEWFGYGWLRHNPITMNSPGGMKMSDEIGIGGRQLDTFVLCKVEQKDDDGVYREVGWVWTSTHPTNANATLEHWILFCAGDRAHKFEVLKASPHEMRVTVTRSAETWDISAGTAEQVHAARLAAFKARKGKATDILVQSLCTSSTI